MADDQKTRDGRGNYGNPEQHAEAGKKGGEATAASHDKSFYEEIGEAGGKASTGSFEKGSKRARDAGRKGGQVGGSNQQDGQRAA